MEVCSIYLFGADGRLTLRASEGLAPEAVGTTSFGPDEGIVGRIGATGETLNLPDATSHPAYAFRAAIGEEGFPAMLAVPIRRAGTTLGVLVVQGRRPLAFPPDDVEALLTAAMVLAEMLAARSDAEVAAPPLRHFRGIPLAPGIVRGRVVLAAGYRKPRQVRATDPAGELARLDRAVERMNEGLERLLAGQPVEEGPDGDAARTVLEATRAVVGAPGWLRRVRAKLADGLVAEAAVHAVNAELRGRMREIADPLLREKLADMEDTAFALLAALDENRGSEWEQLPPGSILLVRRLGPAKLLHWQARGIAGLVIAEASPAGHAAILARSMGLPAIGGLDGALEAAEDGVDAVLDADEGRLLLQPEPEVDRHYARALERIAAQGRAWAAMRDTPSVTRDGADFTLMLNAGLPAELAEIDRLGADGVGLFRTEIFALARGEIPSEDEQESFYRRALALAGDRPLLFRTLDLGADKLLPGAQAAEEENPAMGWRSIRVGLDNPSLLRRQLRAMLRAGAGRRLCIMFPMISEVAEFERARRFLEDERAKLADDAGRAPAHVAVGTMLEVPALLQELPALFAAADFVSIGSNDLLQFLFAADRGTARLANRYDLFSPASLAVVEAVAEAGRATGKPVSLCGEMAGRPLEALTLLALGVRALSMSPRFLPRVKAALTSADVGAFRTRLLQLRAAGVAGAALRSALASFAAEAGTTM